MTRTIGTTGLGIVLAVLGCAFQTTPASAQAAEPDALCFRGKPRSACTAFFLTEVSGFWSFLTTVRYVPTEPVGEAFCCEGTSRVAPLKSHFGLHLGAAWNRSDLWALGGTVGLEGPDEEWVLRARIRRWLSARSSVELLPGAYRERSVEDRRGTAPWGPTLAARFNYQDRFFVAGRYHGVRLPAHVESLGTTRTTDPGGWHHALSIGGGIGGDVTAGAAGVAAVGGLVLGVVLVIAVLRELEGLG